MRTKNIKVAIERYEEQSEYYKVAFTTHNEKIEANVDKETLRELIETIDNEII